LRVMQGGDGPNELPPSRGWTYLVEKKIISKPRGDH
jgi:hypothetical protein